MRRAWFEALALVTLALLSGETLALAQTPPGAKADFLAPELVEPKWSASSPAQDQKALLAQALFDEGMRLMKAGSFAEACPKLAEAQRIDAGIATQFRLAECYEKLGRTATAWALFIEVADAAHAAQSPEREAFARKRAVMIAPKVPKLSLLISSGAQKIQGLEIRIDDKLVEPSAWGTTIPVDPGEHRIAAKATHRKDWESKKIFEAAAKLEVLVPELEPVTPAHEVSPKPPPPTSRRDPAPNLGSAPSRPDKSREVVLITGIAASIALVGAGTGLAITSQLKASASHEMERPGADCFPQCRAQFDALQRERATFANISLWAFIGAGLAGVGTGLFGVLSIPSAGPKGRARAHLFLSPTGAGAAATATW